MSTVSAHNRSIQLLIVRNVFISTGFGLAFNLQPSLTIIGTYFHIKRPLANGLAMTGSPVVLFTLAPLNQLFLILLAGEGVSSFWDQLF